MTRRISAYSLAFFVLLAGPGFAEIGAVDNVPAATLLLPRFEVELNEPPGQALTTLLAITNASNEVVLAHVTLWSEWFVAIVSFDVYLTGYDVQTINLYDIIARGDLPNTGPTQALSNLGDFSSGPHNSFGGTCSTTLGNAPNYSNISGLFLEVMQQGLTGQPLTTTGLCSSAPGNEDLARGFATVDVVQICSNEFPNSVGYFVDGGNGIATNDNVLLGDYFILDPENDFAQGWSLVHLEADGLSLGVASGSCDVADRNPTTFYCTLRDSDAVAGEDNREGLPSVYGTRYLSGGAFTGGTQLLAWRDKNGIGANDGFGCESGPAPFDQRQIVAFDEHSNPLLEGLGPGGQPVIPEIPFPYATNRAKVGEDITVDRPFGLLFLNLNSSSGERRQAFVETILSGVGVFSVGYGAFPLNNLTLGSDTRRGPRNSDPTLGPPSNPNTPTLFSTFTPP